MESGAPEIKTALNIASNAQVFQISAIKPPTPNYLSLHNGIVGNGSVGLLLPKEMFPFVNEGDSVLVSITVTRIAIEPSVPKPGKLLLPGKH